MLNSLKNHPFAVKAFFTNSTVLTFAVPKEQLQPIIPNFLSVDVFNDKWAFVAVAMVQTKSLRPALFPSWLGNNFFLIGYRIFVRYTNAQGKNLRGLYILKSETDKKKMEWLGNIFTLYKYTTTDINIIPQQGSKIIRSKQSNFSVEISNDKENVQLPTASPFLNWKEARRFAGPLPFTFTKLPNQNKVLIIEGVREDWIPKPLEIINYKFDFLSKLQLDNAILANAFEITNIPYSWKKGKIEKWHK
jgi:hypothetical protein